MANRTLRLAARILGVLVLSSSPALVSAATYVQVNLVSNTAGNAAVTDPNLVDPWGMSFSTGSPFWISNHLSATSTLYNGSGTITHTVVKIPAGASAASGAIGRPMMACARTTCAVMTGHQTTSPSQRPAASW